MEDIDRKIIEIQKLQSEIDHRTYHSLVRGCIAMSDLAHKLRQLRIDHNLKQRQLAEKLNVSQNAVFNWENGKRTPTPDMIKQIANHFQVSPSYLMGWEARKKMTVQALANAYGVSRTRINVLLNQREVSTVSAGRMASALGVDVTEILENN